MSKDTPKICPLNDRIVVQPEEAETKTAGGILIPDTADKEKPMVGTVLNVGNGKYVEGKRQPLDVKPGDKILFGKYAGNNIKFEGREYLIMREEDVLGVLAS